MTDNKHKKVNLLPLTSDLVKLNESLQESIPECCKAVNECQSHQSYISLVDITLTSIILFNKQRSAEASRVHVDSYNYCQMTKSGLDIESALTNVKQKLCTRLKLVQIAGK